MWPGQQPPGGEQNPKDSNPYQQPGYQQPNPYQQPGYQQQNPYMQDQGQQQPWATPTVQIGGTPPGGGDDRRAMKVTAIVAAVAVVVAAGVTGYLVLGKDDDKGKTAGPAHSPSPSKSSAPATTGGTSGGDDNPRGGSGPKPTIPGWKVVVNPKWGTAFDVPQDWTVDDPGVITGFGDQTKDDGSLAIAMSAPAWAKEKWCTSDSDHDGSPSDTALAGAGTKGQNGAKNTEEPAVNDSAWWVFSGYTHMKDSDKKLLTIGKAKPYTTKSGIKGHVASSYTKGVKKTDKCDSDGKATTFAFKNSVGDFVTWTLYGAKGVADEVPDATVKKILSTVRLHGKPTGGS